MRRHESDLLEEERGEGKLVGSLQPVPAAAVAGCGAEMLQSK